jgi:lysophospholipase L1-like esterase
MRIALAALIAAPAVVAFCRLAGWPPDDPPSTPTGRSEVYWRRLHEGFREYAGRESIELLFLGDSITDGWDDNSTWRRYYAPRRAAHFGIGGDRTQHLLYRVENGEIDGMTPKVIVVLIGTNNIGADPPEQIAAGIRKVVEAIRRRAPTSRVLVLGVLPRGRFAVRATPRAQPDPRPAEINALLRNVEDDGQVRFLDVSSAFLRDGEPVKALMPDFLHLSEDGYRALAEAMEPTLAELLGR